MWRVSLWEPFFLTTREFELKMCKKILIFINIHILESAFLLCFLAQILEQIRLLSHVT